MKFDAAKLARLMLPRFVDGQNVTVNDLRAVLEYQRAQQWQHNRLLHGYGIVVGLEVVIQELAKGDAEVVIAPGYALDGFGRELVVYDALRLKIGQDRRDFVVYLKFLDTDEQDLQVLFEPSNERLTAPTTRSDFAIPLARFRKPHLQWQHDRDFRPPRTK